MSGSRREIRKVIIVVNSRKADAEGAVRAVEEYARSTGVQTVFVDFANHWSAERLEGADMAITLGGDGTLLSCARMLAASEIPILAVNMGDVGFITEVAGNELIDAWEQFRAGSLGVSERLMLSVNVLRGGEQAASFLGLNDAVISNKGISRLIRLKVFLSDLYVGRYRADGVIVATPTGSTAYSMAAGGPILHPEMDAFILTPICPFSLSIRPTVVPASESLCIEVEEQQRTDTVLTIDGQETHPLLPGDRVMIGRAPKKARIIRSDKRSFYEVLRTKLNWTGEPNA